LTSVANSIKLRAVKEGEKLATLFYSMSITNQEWFKQGRLGYQPKLGPLRQVGALSELRAAQHHKLQSHHRVFPQHK